MRCVLVFKITSISRLFSRILLEDVAVLDNLDAILSVPGVELYSIGPNDFAQSLGYPGQPDHPEVVKTMQEITRRIRQAGRTGERRSPIRYRLQTLRDGPVYDRFREGFETADLKSAKTLLDALGHAQ